MSENNKTKKGFVPSHAFKPGQSGNPGGRPKALIPVIEAAREHTVAAIQTLADICRDVNAPPPARVSAASVLLDRGWGKPKQEHDINHNLPTSRATDAALLAIALAGGGLTPASEGDSVEPTGVVH